MQTGQIAGEMKRSYQYQLDSLPIKVIAQFRKKHISAKISSELKQYVFEMDAVMQIRNGLGSDNKSRIARKLILRFPHLTFRTARKRVYDAYNFFHVENTVPPKVWFSIYADKMEDLAALCIAGGKLSTALICFNAAHESRVNSKDDICPKDLAHHTYIISNNCDPLIPGNNKLNKIAVQKLNSHFRELINSLNISSLEKKNLLKDAGIKDNE